jgi:pyruvate/2-oxoglutarate dehydrogenase complex dihydrolipoamide acyltransferase (E2) component
MNQQHVDCQEVPYLDSQRWRAAAYRTVRHKTMIHGLFAADVTRAREALRNHKAQTGEALSFTAFLIACLAKAVDEDKAVQAMRKGGKRLVIFDDVDVWTPMELDAGGQKALLAHTFRAANYRSFRAIHDELRAAQAAEVTHVRERPHVLPAACFGPYLWLWRWIWRAFPRLQKRAAGTVGLTAVGMFGAGAGWGVPPPAPMALMLTVGGIDAKQEIADGQVVTREYLSLTISVDHDLVDGAPAARFVRRLKELIGCGYGLGDLEAESEPRPMTEVYR